MRQSHKKTIERVEKTIGVVEGGVFYLMSEKSDVDNVCRSLRTAQICNTFGISKTLAERSIHRLEKNGFISVSVDNYGNNTYTLNIPTTDTVMIDKSSLKRLKRAKKRRQRL